MGLWQSSVTVNMSGMPNNPNMPSGAGGGSMTHVNQSCMTPGQLARRLPQSMQQRRQPGGQAQLLHSERLSGCPTRSPSTMNCSSQQGLHVPIVHVQMLLAQRGSDGTANATVKMSGPNFPRGMSMTSIITSKFVSSDCGDVKPGQSKPVQP